MWLLEWQPMELGALQMRRGWWHDHASPIMADGVGDIKGNVWIGYLGGSRSGDVFQADGEAVHAEPGQEMFGIRLVYGAGEDAPGVGGSIAEKIMLTMPWLSGFRKSSIF